MATGFVNRAKGKELFPASCLTQFGTGGALFRGGGNIYTNQSATGITMTSTTAEVTLDTFSLPASSLDVPGRGISIVAYGTFANNTHAKTAKLYFGTSVTQVVTGNTAAVVPWIIEALVLKDAASSQAVSLQTINGTTHGGCVYTSGSEPDTAAITIKVTGQTGTAGTDVTLNGWIIQGMD